MGVSQVYGTDRGSRPMTAIRATKAAIDLEMRRLDQRRDIIGVHPGSLRFFTVAACTPYRRGDEIGELPVWITAGWRIARHSDPRDKGSVYGVKRGSRSENMAYI